ncbi:hypothetical protein [Desulfitobacterium sp.]|nr:hypothetical protein [Desulfitobacterium sp.]HVJ48452.1 hypothetical protein [Desulfitobacterium sp.]
MRLFVGVVGSFIGVTAAARIIAELGTDMSVLLASIFLTGPKVTQF